MSEDINNPVPSLEQLLGQDAFRRVYHRVKLGSYPLLVMVGLYCGWQIRLMLQTTSVHDLRPVEITAKTVGLSLYGIAAWAVFAALLVFWEIIRKNKNQQHEA